MKHYSSLLLACVLMAVFISCQKSEEILLIEDAYTAKEYLVLTDYLDLPESLHSYGFGNKNPGLQTDHKGTLGRILFYDKNLSSDGTISCASCHQQSLAFADDKPFSVGVHGKLTHRNSLALGSLRSFGAHYQQEDNNKKARGLFWDERAKDIKDQLVQTIGNPNEMDMSMREIAELVERTDYYRILYEKSFGTVTISDDHLLEAIEVFINSINSTTTRLEAGIFDNLNFINGDNVTGATGHEMGVQLFKNHCNSCHTTSLHHLLKLQDTDLISIANNGLPLEKDLGIYQQTLDPADIGKFKVPGLHNIELTAPYMHDGRFSTLEEVVEYYNSGIINHPNLHPNLKKGDQAIQLKLTKDEKNALVGFLLLLTDESVTTEEKWSDPFL